MNCPYCRSESASDHIHVREMMLGTREIFQYACCGGCGSLYRISDIDDLSRFYPKSYYAFSGAHSVNPVKSFMKRHVLWHRLGIGSKVGSLVARWLPEPMMVRWLSMAGVTLNTRILDVGCGDGLYLREMSLYGFTSLTGVDPFIDKDIHTDRGVVIRKRYLREMDGNYDLIMMHHSLEHVPDPAEMLLEAKKRLRSGGKILVRLPIAGSSAQAAYGSDWVQWDAPRHIHIPTVAGMRALCERLDLNVEAVAFDSDSFQYWGSELYRMDIPLKDFHGQVNRHRADWIAMAARDNETGLGDQACFLLVPKTA